MFEPMRLFFLSRLVKGQVDLSINTKTLGVILPRWLYEADNCKLEIGLAQAKPIPDLDVGEFGIRCTLSFNNSPFTVSIPWYSVWFMCPSDDKADGFVVPAYAPPAPDAEKITGTEAPQAATVKQTHTAKPKKALPAGWGGVVVDNTKGDE